MQIECLLEGSENRLNALNALIIPTRGRGKSITEHILSTSRLSTSTDIFLSVDNSDESDYGWVDNLGITLIRGANTSMNQALNRAAVQVCNEYEFVSFMGDDHVARTENWDGRLMEAARQSGSPGLSYGNDLLAGEALPTAVLMDSRLIRTLGYMTPPSLRHMFLDDFWLEIGTRLGRIRYLEDVVVEHMHFSAGKSVKDLTYESTNQNIKNFNDGLRYKLYLNLRAKADVEKIKRLSD